MVLMQPRGALHRQIELGPRATLNVKEKNQAMRSHGRF